MLVIGLFLEENKLAQVITAKINSFFSSFLILGCATTILLRLE